VSVRLLLKITFNLPYVSLVIRNKFAALQNLEDSGDVNRAGNNITKNIKLSTEESIGFCESKHRKPWFDKECSKLIDRRKQAKLQWLQDPREANGDILSDVRREDGRHFRKNKREYLKDKINKPESNGKNKNIRVLYSGINEIKKGYKIRTNLVKDERGDLVADPHKILNRWKNYFCQLLNVNGVGDVRQTEMHTAEPFVPQPRASEVDVAIGKMERYISPGIYQIPGELIQAGGEILRSEIHKLIKLIWNKEQLPHQWKKQLWYLLTKRVIKLTVVIIKAHRCCQLHTNFYQTFFSLG
jgi:hypothetical protein